MPSTSTLTPETRLPDGRSLFIPMPLFAIPAGAIFDCDGTLADTMPLHYRAWREILDPLGLPFPEPQFYEWGGVTAVEVIERLNRMYDKTVPAHHTAEIKEAAYARLLDQAQPLPTIVAEARRLHGLCPLAVASGGIKPLVNRTLEALDIADLFEAVATVEDVRRGKPAPDIFLLAAERIGVKPEACVVFEDGPAGMEAAFAAGMQVVDVRSYV